MSGSGGDDDDKRRSARQRRARERMLRLVDDQATAEGGNPHVPVGAPFKPLGNMDGLKVAILDSHGAFQIITARDLSRNNLQRLFSKHPKWLFQRFPRVRKGVNLREGETADAFHPELAAGMIMDACAWVGAWSPSDRLRGRGTWLGEDGDVVRHNGDSLWINGKLVDAGQERGGIIYPRYSPIMQPHDKPQGSPSFPFTELDRVLSKFRLKRQDAPTAADPDPLPGLDRRLLAGWIVAAMVGGALKVRPLIWLSGSPGTGKSTLVNLIVAMFGPAGCVYAANTTAAGVWQTLNEDCLPVILDETEPSQDNRRINSLIELARVAYSGGDLKRGSTENSAHGYPLRSSFMMASVNVASMRPQDRSRTVIVELEKVPVDASPPNVDDMPMLGRAILRRALDHWQRLDRLIRDYRLQLIYRGFDQRQADSYGTLLACCSVIETDVMEPLDISRELDSMYHDLQDTLDRQREEEKPDWQHCIEHLRGQIVDPYRNGERRPIGELVRKAAGLPPSDNRLAANNAPVRRTIEQQIETAQHNDDAVQANLHLQAIGLRVRLDWPDGASRDGPQAIYVAIANNNPALQEFFRNTHWQGISGGSAGWRAPLQRAPGAIFGGEAIYFRDGRQRAVQVPIGVFLGEDDTPDPTEDD